MNQIRIRGRALRCPVPGPILSGKKDKLRGKPPAPHPSSTGNRKFLVMLSAMTAMSVLRFSKRAAFVPVRPLGVREVHLAASRESRGAVADRPASCSSRNAPRQSLRVRASATRAPVSMTVSRHHCARSRVALFASPRWNIKKGPCPSRSATPVLKGPTREFIRTCLVTGNAWHPCRMSTTAWRFSG